MRCAVHGAHSATATATTQVSEATTTLQLERKKGGVGGGGHGGGGRGGGARPGAGGYSGGSQSGASHLRSKLGSLGVVVVGVSLILL